MTYRLTTIHSLVANRFGKSMPAVSNSSPLEGLGGPWILPKSRPVYLRPMLNRYLYHTKAEVKKQ